MTTPATPRGTATHCVTFTNPGEIDIRAIRFMGVNAKSHATAIGEFGTGAKYAISVLLRLGQRIVIATADTEYVFTSRPETIRGKVFHCVYMNNESLGITTDLGKRWELWQAFRELYSNALDEGGTVREGAAAPPPGGTAIRVEGEAFHAVYRNRGDYFLLAGDVTPRIRTPRVEIYARRAKPLYYRGIACGPIQAAGGRTARYSYNLLDHVQLTEDRTMGSSVTLSQALAELVLRSDDEAFIAEFITGGPDAIGGGDRESYEYNCDLDWSIDPSEAFMAATERNLHRCNHTAKQVFLRVRIAQGRSTEFTIAPLNAMQKRMLMRAEDFISRVGYEAGLYDIRIARDLGADILGTVRGRSTIWLALRVFEMGTKQVASTLLEEYVHLNRGYGDMQREMQSFLFDKIITLVEELREEPI